MMTIKGGLLRNVGLMTIAIAAAACAGEETPDGEGEGEGEREGYAITTQAVVGQHTFLYFTCNATGWNPAATTRLVPGSSPGTWTIAYGVTEAWMTTNPDTCTVVETNQRDGWGTQQKFYDKTGQQLLMMPVAGPGTGQLVLARPGQDYHFKVQYRALGRYSLTVNWQTKAFSIERTTGPNPVGWLWPVTGSDGEAWVINNYVDLDTSSGIRDYRGGMKSYDGHAGIDIDIPSFVEMDLGRPVLAVRAGQVTATEEGQPDRNTSCQGDWNFVSVLTDDGFQVTYGHLKRDSVVVNVGSRVEVGATLGMVGSSGCSTWPHLHLEAFRTADGALVDPFRDGLWANPPVYDPPLTVMRTLLTDQEIVNIETLADPPANASVIVRGGWLGVGINAAGGSNGDQLTVRVTDATGALFQTGDISMPEGARHTLWIFNWIVGTDAPTGVWRVDVLVNGALNRTHTVQVN
jgi:murein DD-endopeptidase MepM/ murein hydrolase activator NlpD